MWKNYLKVAARNFLRQRVTSGINVLGLTSGTAAFLLITIFVLDELRFDKHHPDGDRIYRITSERGGQDQSGAWAGTSPALGPTLVRDFPEVERSLRLHQLRQKQLFKRGDMAYLEDKGFFAEPSIFEMFDLPLREGDPKEALDEPYEVVITAELAHKYFGDEEALDQTIKIGRHDTKIVGVLDDLSPHFHLDFNFLVSFQNLVNQVSEARINSWVWQDFSNYIRLTPQATAEQVSSKLPALVEQYAHPQTKEYGFHYYVHLQPLDKVHLHSSHLQNDPARRGNYTYVISLGAVGLFLLLIACINFINLSTAKAIRRAKEVGVRKVTGARRDQLMVQFVSEAMLTVAISVLIASQITYFLVPSLSTFMDRALTFPLYSDWRIGVALLAMTLVVGLLAGGYPSFVLSGFRPAAALSGSKVQQAGHIKWLRSGLVVLQFSISILLIISALVIFNQIKYLNETNLGFDKEQLLHFTLKGKMYRNFEQTKAEFERVPGVSSTSICFGIPGDIVSGDDIIIPGENRRHVPARIFTVDHDYISTVGMEIIAGRDFSKDITTDASHAFIVNETAVRHLSLGQTAEEAIGKPLEWKMWTDHDTIKEGQVIGVVKDFHYSSMHERVETAVLQIYPDAYWKMALRLDPSDLTGTIAGIEAAWDQFESGYPFDYQFVDESFGRMYTEEQRLKSMLWIFTLLAILIATIGAFGLATYATEQRRKEIGIRKVLGASVSSIVALMSRDFLRLVALALVVATPLAWYFLQDWLQSFAYRIQLQWWTFALAGIAALAIAGLTVGIQSLGPALTNPVKALRQE